MLGDSTTLYTTHTSDCLQRRKRHNLTASQTKQKLAPAGRLFQSIKLSLLKTCLEYTRAGFYEKCMLLTMYQNQIFFNLLIICGEKKKKKNYNYYKLLQSR